MPHVELELYLQDGSASLMWSRSREHRELLRDADSYPGYKVPAHGQVELQVLVNNDDWSYCEPFDGVRLEVAVGGLPARGEGEYRARLEGNMSWRQVGLLRDFLSGLLGNPEALRGVRDGPEGYVAKAEEAA